MMLMRKLISYWNIAFSLENPNRSSPEDYLEGTGPFLSLPLKKSKDFNAACKGAEHK